MSKKLKVLIFQNGENRVYLPYATDCKALIDVTMRLVKQSNRDQNLQHVKLKRMPSNEILVDHVHLDGFVIDGHKYSFGEVYRRVD